MKEKPGYEERKGVSDGFVALEFRRVSVWSKILAGFAHCLSTCVMVNGIAINPWTKLRVSHMNSGQSFSFAELVMAEWRKNAHIGN
jgi:hypothetical protein